MKENQINHIEAPIDATFLKNLFLYCQDRHIIIGVKTIPPYPVLSDEFLTEKDRTRLVRTFEDHEALSECMEDLFPDMDVDDLWEDILTNPNGFIQKQQLNGVLLVNISLPSFFPVDKILTKKHPRVGGDLIVNPCIPVEIIPGALKEDIARVKINGKTYEVPEYALVEKDGTMFLHYMNYNEVHNLVLWPDEVYDKVLDLYEKHFEKEKRRFKKWRKQKGGRS